MATINGQPERVIRVGDVRIAIFNHDGFRTAAVECRYNTPGGGRAVTRSWSAANLLLLVKAAEWAAQVILMAEDEERQLQGEGPDR